MVGKCWGRATVQKGNIKLLYQDFRVRNFEPRGTNQTMECHNDKIAKLGDDLFIENAWSVWEELFEVADDWPDVIFMLTNGGLNYVYDFDYHTKRWVLDVHRATLFCFTTEVCFFQFHYKAASSMEWHHSLFRFQLYCYATQHGVCE
jgi:hypothetical protein